MKMRRHGLGAMHPCRTTRRRGVPASDGKPAGVPPAELRFRAWGAVRWLGAREHALSHAHRRGRTTLASMKLAGPMHFEFGRLVGRLLKHPRDLRHSTLSVVGAYDDQILLAR